MFYCISTHTLSSSSSLFVILFFFFNDTATTEIYTLSLHDALPISVAFLALSLEMLFRMRRLALGEREARARSEEHTSELQSLTNLVCRLLLEKKKKHTAELQSLTKFACRLLL